jgi:hypothetical protein
MDNLIASLIGAALYVVIITVGSKFIFTSQFAKLRIVEEILNEKKKTFSDDKQEFIAEHPEFLTRYPQFSANSEKDVD